MYFKFLSTKYVVRKIFVSIKRVQTVSKPTFVSACVSQMPVYMLKTKNKKKCDLIFLEARKTRSKLDRLSTKIKYNYKTDADYLAARSSARAAFLFKDEITDFFCGRKWIFFI